MESGLTGPYQANAQCLVEEESNPDPEHALARPLSMEGTIAKEQMLTQSLAIQRSSARVSRSTYGSLSGRRHVPFFLKQSMDNGVAGCRPASAAPPVAAVCNRRSDLATILRLNTTGIPARGRRMGVNPAIHKLVQVKFCFHIWVVIVKVNAFLCFFRLSGIRHRTD